MSAWRRAVDGIMGNQPALLLAIVLAVVLLFFHDKNRDLRTVCEAFAPSITFDTDTPKSERETAAAICVDELHPASAPKDAHN